MSNNNIYLVWDSKVERDDSKLSLSVTYNLKTYSKQDIIVKDIVVDETGNTQSFPFPSYVEENLIAEKIITYIIPEEDRTTCYHSEEHPHVYEDEIEYQEKSTKWLEDVMKTDEWINAEEELMRIPEIIPIANSVPEIIETVESTITPAFSGDNLILEELTVPEGMVVAPPSDEETGP
jgi:hypothetical protein